MIYQGISRWKNLDTEEIIETSEIIKKIGRNGFMITYLSAIINLIEVLGNKKMQVVKYMLANMDQSSNTLIITTRELASEVGCSHNIVLQTLKILESANIIRRRTGAIMINAELIHRGNESKEKMLLTRFHAFDPDFDLGFESDEPANDT